VKALKIHNAGDIIFIIFLIVDKWKTKEDNVSKYRKIFFENWKKHKINWNIGDLR